MATPIGHALLGYAVYECSGGRQRQDHKAILLLCLLLAIAPDFDFIPGILFGQPARYHQGISHSLGVACLVSLGVAIAYSLRRGFMWADWGRFFLAYSSHLLMDVFGPDKRPPYGIPLFWPVSDSYYLSPWQVFWGVRHATATSATTGDWVAGIFHPDNLGAIGIEVVVTLVVILLLRGVRTLVKKGQGGIVPEPN